MRAISLFSIQKRISAAAVAAKKKRKRDRIRPISKSEKKKENKRKKCCSLEKGRQAGFVRYERADPR